MEVSRQVGMTRLELAVEDCRPLAAGLPACDRLSRVRLSVYQGPDMRAGERWRLTARLRPPSGFANPGTFDYRGWLWREASRPQAICASHQRRIGWPRPVSRYTGWLWRISMNMSWRPVRCAGWRL